MLACWHERNDGVVRLASMHSPSGDPVLLPAYKTTCWSISSIPILDITILPFTAKRAWDGRCEPGILLYLRLLLVANHISPGHLQPSYFVSFSGWMVSSSFPTTPLRMPSVTARRVARLCQHQSLSILGNIRLRCLPTLVWGEDEVWLVVLGEVVGTLPVMFVCRTPPTSKGKVRLESLQLLSSLQTHSNEPVEELQGFKNLKSTCFPALLWA